MSGEAVEKVRHEPGDPMAWICLCGNTPDTGGFYPYTDGREVEPTPEAWDGRSYFCADCLRVIDMESLQVTAHPDHVELLT